LFWLVQPKRNSLKLYEVLSNRLSCDHYPRVGKTVLVRCFLLLYLSSNSSLGDLGGPSLNIDGLVFPRIRGVISSRQLSLLNRQYSIEIDTLHDRFKTEVIDPWIRKLKEDGEKALLETAEMSLMAAKDLITSALLEREDRCKRELDEKEKFVGEERVGHLTAIYSNLLATEEALGGVFARIRALQT
jgi:hypothetical protein